MVASPPILEVPKARKAHSADNKSKVNNQQSQDEGTTGQIKSIPYLSDHIRANRLPFGSRIKKPDSDKVNAEKFRKKVIEIANKTKGDKGIKALVIDLIEPDVIDKLIFSVEKGIKPKDPKIVEILKKLENPKTREAVYKQIIEMQDQLPKNQESVSLLNMLKNHANASSRKKLNLVLSLLLLLQLFI